MLSLPFTPQGYARRICLPDPLRAWTPSSFRALHLSSCVTPSLNRLPGGTGISTSCPSPTPFGLGLGPGLPWADEPSPGNLRFTAGRILTCLLAYSCQHSHFLTVHYSFRYSFCPLGTLPYPALPLSNATVLRFFLMEFVNHFVVYS